MDVTSYIIQCVDKYIEVTNGKKDNLRVFIDCSRKFVQIGGFVYIPNCDSYTLNGHIMRSTDLVEGWDKFDNHELIIPFVKDIVVYRNK
jgi:hypothetical protein